MHALMRWGISPLAVLGLGLIVGFLGLAWSNSGRVHDLPLFGALLGSGAILTVPLTWVLLRAEQVSPMSSRTHFRQCALAYLFLVPCGAALVGGGHGAIFFARPFAALLGVVTANIIVVRTRMNRGT